MKNFERCKRAALALAAYIGGEAPDYGEPWEQDLITDLLHLVDSRGGNALYTLRVATLHYNAEQQGVES